MSWLWLLFSGHAYPTREKIKVIGCEFLNNNFYLNFFTNQIIHFASFFAPQNRSTARVEMGLIIQLLVQFCFSIFWLSMCPRLYYLMLSAFFSIKKNVPLPATRGRGWTRSTFYAIRNQHNSVYYEYGVIKCANIEYLMPLWNIYATTKDKEASIDKTTLGGPASAPGQDQVFKMVTPALHLNSAKGFCSPHDLEMCFFSCFCSQPATPRTNSHERFRTHKTEERRNSPTPISNHFLSCAPIRYCKEPVPVFLTPRGQIHSAASIS